MEIAVAKAILGTKKTPQTPDELLRGLEYWRSQQKLHRIQLRAVTTEVEHHKSQLPILKQEDEEMRTDLVHLDIENKLLTDNIARLERQIADQEEKWAAAEARHQIRAQQLEAQKSLTTAQTKQIQLLQSIVESQAVSIQQLTAANDELNQKNQGQWEAIEEFTRFRVQIDKQVKRLTADAKERDAQTLEAFTVINGELEVLTDVTASTRKIVEEIVPTVNNYLVPKAVDLENTSQEVNMKLGKFEVAQAKKDQQQDKAMEELRRDVREACASLSAEVDELGNTKGNLVARVESTLKSEPRSDYGELVDESARRRSELRDRYGRDEETGRVRKVPGGKK